MPIPATHRPRLQLAAGILIAYAIAVLTVTLWPTPVDQGFQPSISRFLGLLHRHGLPVWFGYNKFEFGANIAMFAPAGFLVALLLPSRRWWLALLICPAISIGIEITQAVFLSSRFATVNDVVANSLGGVVGVVIYLVACGTLRTLVARPH
jgi:glycopeptide antibiotics resistance protein